MLTKGFNFGPSMVARMAILLTGVLINTGIGACGSGDRRQHASSSYLSASATSDDSPRRALNDAHGEQRLLGDYDEDEYIPGHRDGDDDDNHGKIDGDGDLDGGRDDRYDGDDGIHNFGHAANKTELGAAEILIRSYYTKAIGGKSTQACSLVYRSLAESLPHDLGQTGPSYLRGVTTCSEFVTRLFRQNRRQLAVYARRLRVADMRVAGTIGLVVLSLGGLPRRKIEVIRENDTWKLDSLIDTELP
jgi:hypothetical protein